MNENRFGGERIDSKSRLSKNNLIEHMARYKLVKGKKSEIVLDIGCGTGHGSSILSRSFKNVYGVDVSIEAISYAKKHWQRKNITFLVGSGTMIPFKDSTFNVAVAFEVFEHIKDWKKFLSELRRVTKNNGLIYISTPNKNIYSPGTEKPINPHHFFEMTSPQFRRALGRYFKVVSFLGQRTPVYNDHWVWKIVDPLLRVSRRIIPYKLNNTIKLRIINWIKPELYPSDIVFREEKDWIEKSRQMVAICTNR